MEAKNIIPTKDVKQESDSQSSTSAKNVKHESGTENVLTKDLIVEGCTEESIPPKDLKRESDTENTNSNIVNPSTSSRNWHEGHRDSREENVNKQEKETRNNDVRDGSSCRSKLSKNFPQVTFNRNKTNNSSSGRHVAALGAMDHIDGVHVNTTTTSHVNINMGANSGYIKIDDKNDAVSNGQLHVDSVEDQDGKHENECCLQSMPREVSHHEMLEQEGSHPPTPPAVAAYSNHEAVILGEKLRSDETIQQALSVLVMWLERGECNKRNSGYFYSLLQSVYHQIRRLLNEKVKCKGEFNRTKRRMMDKKRTILLQFDMISKMFNAARLEKVWDHFTKPQRRNIELWKEQAELDRSAFVEGVVNEKMNVSDGEKINRATVRDSLKEEVERMREENNVLRFQLWASEILIAHERFERQCDKKADCTINKLQREFMNMGKQPNSAPVSVKGDADSGKCSVPIKRRKEENYSETFIENAVSEGELADCMGLSLCLIAQHEARLIGLISIYLNIHPFGARVDYICSYLRKWYKNILEYDVETLMKKFPILFKEKSTGMGASLEKEWFFCGYESQD